MTEILVINLTRMGDIVQSSALIAGLRQKFPKAHISLLVIDVFATIARLIPELDDVRTWSQDNSISRLMAPGWDLEQAFIWHRDFVDGLRDRQWDLVINLTHSRDSALLCHMLKPGEIRGLSVHHNGMQDMKHDWVKYFFNVTANRGFNNFNLVDIYRRIGNLDPGQGDKLSLDPGSEARQWLKARTDSGPGHNGPRILLQMGASKENRRWPVRNFLAAARQIHLETGAHFVLCGTAKEQALSNEFLAKAGDLPVEDFCGQTNLAQLGALCESADLLISNDTGTMHIGAALGTPVLSLFLATALPEETAAWVEGAWILQADIACTPCSHHVECPHVVCREYISAATVAHAAKLALGHPVSAEWPDPEKVRVYTSEKDTLGFQRLRSILPKTLRAQDVLALCYRCMWQLRLRPGLLRHSPLNPGDLLAQELPGLLESSLSCDSPSAFNRELDDCAEGFRELMELAAEGRAVTQNVIQSLQGPEPDLAVLEKAVLEISRIDTMIFDLELAYPGVRPIAVLFRFDKDELEQEEDLLAMSHAMEQIYLELSARAEEMQGLLSRARQRVEVTPDPMEVLC